VEFNERILAIGSTRENLIELDEALERLSIANSQAAQVVDLVYFVGLSVSDAAGIIGVSVRTAGRLWAYARAWLRSELKQ